MECLCPIVALFECVRQLNLLGFLHFLDHLVVVRLVDFLQQGYKILVARALAELEQRVLRLLVPERLRLWLREPLHKEADVRFRVQKSLFYCLAVTSHVAPVSCLVFILSCVRQNGEDDACVSPILKRVDPEGDILVTQREEAIYELFDVIVPGRIDDLLNVELVNGDKRRVDHDAIAVVVHAHGRQDSLLISLGSKVPGDAVELFFTWR